MSYDCSISPPNQTVGLALRISPHRHRNSRTNHDRRPHRTKCPPLCSFGIVAFLKRNQVAFLSNSSLAYHEIVETPEARSRSSPRINACILRAWLWRYLSGFLTCTSGKLQSIERRSARIRLRKVESLPMVIKPLNGPERITPLPYC